jgi:hypothetical protein
MDEMELDYGYNFRVFPGTVEIAEVEEWLNETAMDQQWAVAKVDAPCPIYHLRSNEIDVGAIAQLFMGEGDEMRAICPVFINHESSRRLEDAAKFWLDAAKHDRDWMALLLELIHPHGLRVRTALELDETTDLGSFLTKEIAALYSCGAQGAMLEVCRVATRDDGTLSVKGYDLLLPVLQEIIEDEFCVLTDSDAPDFPSEERIAEAIGKLAERSPAADQALEDLGIRLSYGKVSAAEAERALRVVPSNWAAPLSDDPSEDAREFPSESEFVEALRKIAEKTASTSALPKWRRWLNKLLGV